MRDDIEMAAEVRSSVVARIELCKREGDASTVDLIAFWEGRLVTLDRRIEREIAHETAALANKTMGRR